MAITDSNWVFPPTVRQFLLAWQSANVGKKRKSLDDSPSLFILDTWKERNRATFEHEAPSAHWMKSTFLFTLWSWAKLYSVDNLDSLVEFLTWLGYR